MEEQPITIRKWQNLKLAVLLQMSTLNEPHSIWKKKFLLQEISKNCPKSKFRFKNQFKKSRFMISWDIFELKIGSEKKIDPLKIDQIRCELETDDDTKNSS